MIALRRPVPQVPTLIGLVGVALAVAALPPLITAALLLGAVVCGVALVRPHLGLALLALVVPFGSLVEQRTGDLPFGPADGLAAVVAAGWLAAVLTRRVERPTLGPLAWPIVVFLGTVGLATSFSESLPAALKEAFRWLELGVVYLAATNLLRERSRLRVVLAALLVAGSAEALLGFGQFFTRIGPPSYQVGPFLRAYGTFGQPNPYAGYLGMILPLSLALVIFWRPARRDWLWRVSLPAAGLMSAAVAMSLSRGAWLGVGLATLLLIVLISRRAAVLVAGGGLAGLAVLMLGAFDALPAVIAQRVQSVSGYFRIFDTRGVQPSPENWAIVERMAHWQAAWEMLVDHPLVGVGPGHYVLAYPDYAVLPYWRDPLGHAHNIYLNLAAELGLVGLSAYLAMLVSWILVGLLVARRLRRGAPGSLGRALALGAVACLVAAAVHNVFDNLYVHGMNLHVGLLLGIVGAVARNLDHRGLDHLNGTPS